MTATTNQTVPLLMTKLSVPRVQTDLVARSRVFERLEEGLKRRLTLISAPPGFGKTTLVTSWLRSSPPENIALAWLSLDERDNDTERFLGYLTKALHLANPDVGETARQMIGAGPSTEPEHVVTQLINDLGLMPGQIVFVIDDYHVIANQEIHNAIDFLIENAPPQVHIVMIGRADPPLSLSRLRGRGEMTDIRADDLRFTGEETQSFLRNIFGGQVASDDILELERRTEGWVTGLQLAAISMRGREDIHAFIQSFSGQHHHIFDYLADEVLGGQPPEIQEFLLQTSLFNQFTAELCDTVTQRTDSHDTLAYLERSNLFISSLDTERRWFRYHHLFADLLRRKLRQTQPDNIPELRRRASLWFEARDDLIEAIWQSINGEDWTRVSGLFRKHERTLFNQGQSKTMLRLLDSMPEAVVQSSPWLLSIRAASYDLNGDTALCLRDLTSMENLLDEIKQDPHRAAELSASERRRLRTAIVRTRGFITILDLDFETARELCDEALDYLEEDDIDLRALTKGIRAQTFWLTGDLESAAAGLRETVELSKLGNAMAARLVGLLGLASIEVEWGHLDRAEDIYAEAVDFAERHGLADWQYTGRIIGFQSEVPFERNELDSALELARHGRELADYWASRHAYDMTYLQLARIHYARRELDLARAVLLQAPPHVMGPGMGEVAQIEAFQALIELELGASRPSAVDETELLTPVSELLDRIWLWTPALRTRAQVLNALGRYADAISLLEPSIEIALDRGWTRQAVRTGSVLALSYHGQGDQGAAIDTFERVLAKAAPHGFLRSILDAGPGIGGIIEMALERQREEGEASVYLNRLLRLAREEHQLRSGNATTPQPGLIEPLSDRELEVLRLIAAGYTNAEVADQLFVVIGTIKSHAHNIYRKLGVRNRTQAIKRGQDLGLID